jgi:lipid A 3-O-deacylase
MRLIRERRGQAAALATVLLAALPSLTHAAVAGISVVAGRGDSGVQSWQLGVQWNRVDKPGETWSFSRFYEAVAGTWHARDEGVRVRSLQEAGAFGIFRLERDGHGASVIPYVQYGLGFRLLSHAGISNRGMAVAFQFDNQIGAGVRFGPNGRYDVGYRLRHISNAGIKEPNAGINFHEVQFTYRFP